MVVGREVASQAVSKVDVENKNVVDSVCVCVRIAVRGRCAPLRSAHRPRTLSLLSDTIHKHWQAFLNFWKKTNLHEKVTIYDKIK